MAVIGSEPRNGWLLCAECAALSPPGAVGWRADLVGDEDVAVYCPECAAREFGGH
jgi:hypothetical protein